jgi:hypothetical protein
LRIATDRHCKCDSNIIGSIHVVTVSIGFATASAYNPLARAVGVTCNYDFTLLVETPLLK